MWVVRKKEFEDEITDLGQRTWKDRVAINREGEDVRQSRFDVKVNHLLWSC